MGCPHCGGKSGYQTKIIFRAVRMKNWDGSDVDTEDYQVVSDTDARCMDCGKPVRAYVKKLGLK